jgi:hypothetical protein
MMNFLSLTTPHKGWFSALVVNIGPKILITRFRGSFGFFHGGVNFCLSCFVQSLSKSNQSQQTKKRM